MEDSILNTIKKMLGGIEDDDSFNTDLMVLINSVFQTLRQLGVGPSKGFTISSQDDLWSDFAEEPLLSNVKTYVYMKVKLIFDPPTNATVMETYKTTVSELEYRLMNDFEEVDNNALRTTG